MLEARNCRLQKSNVSLSGILVACRFPRSVGFSDSILFIIIVFFYSESLPRCFSSQSAICKNTPPPSNSSGRLELAGREGFARRFFTTKAWGCWCGIPVETSRKGTIREEPRVRAAGLCISSRGFPCSPARIRAFSSSPDPIKWKSCTTNRSVPILTILTYLLRIIRN